MKTPNLTLDSLLSIIYDLILNQPVFGSLQLIRIPTRLVYSILFVNNIQSMFHHTRFMKQ